MQRKFNSPLGEAHEGRQSVFVPAGRAWIGSDRPGESPLVLIHAPAFYLDKFAVSNRDFAMFIEQGGYRNFDIWDAEGYAWVQKNEISQPAYWGDSSFNALDQPVTGVSFYEACAFAAWIGGRLPTEIEWEKAARGNDKRTYPWGDDEVDSNLARFAPGFAPENLAPGPVQDLPGGESPYGCRQMAGNVFEWCSDFFHFDTPTYRTDGFLAERRPSGRRVLKGGAWHTGASRLRISARWSFTPDLRDNIVGVRVAYDPSAEL